VTKKMKTRKLFRAIAIVVCVLCALTIAPRAFSQGCSLCYTQVANSGARTIRALQNGIVILIIPPLSLCLAAMILAFRKRNQFHDADGSEPRSDW
jgi:hypothetical protein